MKKYLAALIPIIIGIGCWAAYAIIGSEVAPDGTLQEPFFLIPFGYLFIALGMLLGIAVSAWSLFRNPQKADKWILGFTLGCAVLAGLYLLGAISPGPFV